jgi:hypothetical protein
MVYHPKLIDAKKYAKIWRDYFKRKHNIGLHLITVWATETTNPKDLGFDAAMEFIPGALGYRPEFSSNFQVDKETISMKIIDTRHSSSVVDYRKVSKQLCKEMITEKTKNYSLYRCVITSWDNDARKKGNDSTIYVNDSPDIYYRWLTQAVETAKKNNGLTFINAWNEWLKGRF